MKPTQPIQFKLFYASHFHSKSMNYLSAFTTTSSKWHCRKTTTILKYESWRQYWRRSCHWCGRLGMRGHWWGGDSEGDTSDDGEDNDEIHDDFIFVVITSKHSLILPIMPVISYWSVSRLPIIVLIPSSDIFIMRFCPCICFLTLNGIHFCPCF